MNNVTKTAHDWDKTQHFQVHHVKIRSPSVSEVRLHDEIPNIRTCKITTVPDRSGAIANNHSSHMSFIFILIENCKKT